MKLYICIFIKYKYRNTNTTTATTITATKNNKKQNRICHHSKGKEANVHVSLVDNYL